MKRFALLGSNLANSLSPKMYAFFSKKSGIPLIYETVELNENATDQEILDVIKQYDGVNVTIPFKFRVGKLLGKNTPKNTVINSPEGDITSYSTDGEGVLAALDYYGIEVTGKHLLILGAGGAAYSATKSLLSVDAELTVVDRHKKKAKNLMKELNIASPVTKVNGILSFIPLKNKLFYVSKRDISKCDFVFDCLYSSETELLKTARKYQKTAINGLSMLFFQGVLNFYLFTGYRFTNTKLLFEEFYEYSYNQRAEFKLTGKKG
ncbi:MAG: NAD(P)-dependent oxidoreductase [Clostridia bacterium]